VRTDNGRKKKAKEERREGKGREGKNLTRCRYLDGSIIG
jgi:hypothetical protein